MTYRAVLLDIEGTTTSISFVYDTLFPFARQNVSAFLQAHWTDVAVQADIALLREQALADRSAGHSDCPAIPDGDTHDARQAAVANVLWQMDSDRKTTGLKSLQGKIWLDGYVSGQLRGHLFDDVEAAMRRWVSEDKDLYIYSSGSVAAQRLLFGHSIAGDLTGLISGYYDTQTGPKKERQSYVAITKEVGLAASDILFLTDNLDEAMAASSAGLQVRLSVRPGNGPLAPHDFQEIQDFRAL